MRGGAPLITMSIQKTININEFSRDKLTSDSVKKFNIILVGEDGAGKEYYAREIHKLNKSKHDFSLIDFETDIIDRKRIVDSLINQGSENFRKDAQENGIFFRRFDLLEGCSMKQIQDFFRKVSSCETSRKVHFLELGILCSVDEGTYRPENKNLQDILDEFFVVEVRIPPLRERMCEFHELVTRMTQDYDQVYRENILQVISSTHELFRQYTWPGNLNELQSFLEGILVLGDRDELTIKKYLSEKFNIRVNGQNNYHPKMFLKVKKEYQNHA